MTITEQIIELILKTQALKFGQFTLKSGRQSPYFFNLGCINQYEDLRTLGQCYAQTIADLDLSFNGLLGAAYKGIPLACYTATELYMINKAPLTLGYDRKEPKDHGEGGQLVGVNEDSHLILIDDVITAGTAMTALIERIKQHSSAHIAGIVVAFDRQECVQSGCSAAQWIHDYYQIPVFSMLNLDTLLEHLPPGTLSAAEYERMQIYRDTYETY